MKEQKMKRPQKKAMRIVKAGQEKSNTDPFGSYTGVCQRRSEIPVQDADDL
ncbi:hypothetical protein H6A12_09515 [Phocea massiliensis]|uniref:Uncharacterized protein n=1 Tax=Merdimmobilis hominis TaxID=2897707 RepID=A0A938X6E2_9FIRM|nr:hypothetical protein [Merdimmobilis hominis]MBM6921392.1 hypothetical protein [Merdimmobilis hominis]